MKKIESAYYGVLPTPIRHHQELKPTHKLLYSEITACLDNNGVCTRNNSYFSRVLNISKGTVTNLLGIIRKHGFIKVTIENEEGTGKFLKRYIIPTYPSQNLGVEDSNQTPHTSGDVGISNGSSREDVLPPTSKNGTLLYKRLTINRELPY